MLSVFPRIALAVLRHFFGRFVEIIDIRVPRKERSTPSIIGKHYPFSLKVHKLILDVARIPLSAPRRVNVLEFSSVSENEVLLQTGFSARVQFRLEIPQSDNLVPSCSICVYTLTGKEGE